MTTGFEVDSCAECDLFSTTCACCGYLLCCCTCCEPCCGTAGSGAKSAGHTAGAGAGDAFNGTDCRYDSYYPPAGRQAGAAAGIYPTRPLDPILLLNCLQCPQPYDDCNHSPAAAITNSSDLFNLCNFHPMGLCNVGTPFDPPSLPTQHPQTPQQPDLLSFFSSTLQGGTSCPPLDPFLSITTPATTPASEPQIKHAQQEQQSYSPAPSSAAETGTTSEKCRKKRVPLTHEQREYLECIYEKDCKPRSIVVQRAAKAIGLDYRYTQYWFQ
ncbi:hypothetical protein HDU80_005734, partial [Chytriomyces hyalinus]